VAPCGKLVSAPGPEEQIGPTCIGSCFCARGLQCSCCDSVKVLGGRAHWFSFWLMTREGKKVREQLCEGVCRQLLDQQTAPLEQVRPRPWLGCRFELAELLTQVRSRITLLGPWRVVWCSEGQAGNGGGDRVRVLAVPVTGREATRATVPSSPPAWGPWYGDRSACHTRQSCTARAQPGRDFKPRSSCSVT